MSNELTKTNKVTLPAVPENRKGAEAIFSAIEFELAKVLPKAIPPAMMVRVAITALQRQPALFQCTSRSLCGCLIECAQLGLTLDANLGHAWIIPYNNRKTGKKEAQLQIGYKGMVLMGKDSADVVFEMEVVYEGEPFKYTRGKDAKLDHEPPIDRETDSGKIIATYALGYFPDGRVKFEVMSRKEVEIIRKRAPSSRGSSPWDTDYAEMTKKTVLRRLFKTIPNARLQRAAALDEMAAVGISQGLASNIAGEIRGAVETAFDDDDGGDGAGDDVRDIADPKAAKKSRGRRSGTRSGKKSARAAEPEPEGEQADLPDPAETDPAGAEPEDGEAKSDRRYLALVAVGSDPERAQGSEWSEADVQTYLADVECVSLDKLTDEDFAKFQTYIQDHDPDGRQV